MMRILVFLFLMVGFASTLSAKDKVQDQHSSIYTKKIIRVTNAINVGDFQSEDAYIDMLKTACKRNKCSSLETQTIQSVGQQIVYCQIRHLKAHGIENSDASAICQSKNAMLGCDSMASPLLRKMCYTGNRYSLRIWQEKELKNRSRNRMPASVKK